MLFSQSHSKFPSAVKRSFTWSHCLNTLAASGSLRCGCARYDNAQVSALPSAGLCVAQLEQQIGTVPAAQLPQFTLWHVSSSCQERSLGAVKTEADPVGGWWQKELRLMPLQYDPPKLLIQSSSSIFFSIPVLQGVPSMLPHFCGFCCGMNL